MDLRCNRHRSAELLIWVRIEQTRSGHIRISRTSGIGSFPAAFHAGHQSVGDWASVEISSKVQLIVKIRFDAVYADLMPVHLNIGEIRRRSNSGRELCLGNKNIARVIGVAGLIANAQVAAEI